MQPARGPEADANTRAVWTLLLVVFAVALAVRLICYTGLIGSDDVIYAGNAARIAGWTYQPALDQFAVRLGLLLPVAAVYRIFGVHEWSTVLVPLLASAAAAMLVGLLALRLSSRTAGWVAGLLMATFPLEVRYASVLLPEPVLQLFLVLGALLFLTAIRTASARYALGACLAFGYAYLVKETSLFVVPAFVVFALVQRGWRTAGWVIAGLALVGFVELMWYLTHTGDILYRLHALGRHNTMGGGMQPAVAPTEMVVKRLFTIYPRAMLVPSVHFGLHSLAALAFTALTIMVWRRSREAWLLVLWAAIPFLYLNFGSSSLSAYRMIPAVPRYLAFVYPPLFILAGFVAARWATTRYRRSVVAVVVACLCATGVYSGLSTRATGYYTHHVERLRVIARTARASDAQICGFSGERADVWRRVLEIVAADRLQCAGAGNRLAIEPDESLAPVAVPAPASGEG